MALAFSSVSSAKGLTHGITLLDFNVAVVLREEDGEVRVAFLPVFFVDVEHLGLELLHVDLLCRLDSFGDEWLLRVSTRTRLLKESRSHCNRVK